MAVEVKNLCNELQTGNRREKIDALTSLRRLCNDKNESTESMLGIFDDCYLHLLKCYSDRFENVRDQAVETVTAFVLRLPPNDFHLLNVVATLVERLGQQETLEESEEIRLQCIIQLHVLIKEYISTDNVKSLVECLDSIVRILEKTIRDAYPAVQREACACIVALARAIDTYDLQPFSERLAGALYTMLNHKHSQARVAAIEALARVSLHINASGEALSRLIMEVSPLLMDSMPLVRQECGQMGVLMLLQLKDRYSYFERIIPLVLCCLKDDSPDVVKHIRPQWLECGKLYYDENETELNKQDMADLMPENYPSGVERPTIGCRGLVQRSLRLLKLITREAGDWKDNVRMHSLKLLYQFVLHAEAAMTAKFFEIYAEMARACRDEDNLVVLEATKVADLMGRLFCYDDWIEHGFDGLEKNRRESYLKCFYYMFTSSVGGPYKDLLRVAKLMQTSDFSQSLQPTMQVYILKLLETLLDKADKLDGVTNEALEELEEGIYISAVKVSALARSSAGDPLEQLTKSKVVLDRISRRQQCSIELLHERYFGMALEYVENLDAALEENSEPILLLHGLIALAGFRAPYLTQLQEKIKLVWQHCTDQAQLKIFGTISVSMLDWCINIGKDVKESTELLRNFIVEIVEPYLKWSAGSAAEAMRSMATATICCIAQGANEEAQELLPMLAKYMPSLLEDRNVTTRHYAIKAIINFPPLEVPELKPLAYAALQRLDDPSCSIRAIAAAVIPKLQPIYRTEMPEPEHDAWEDFIRRAIDLMLLHYEGPEIRLKLAVEQSLIELDKKHSTLLQERVNNAINKAYNKKNLEELLTKMTLNETVAT